MRPSQLIRAGHRYLGLASAFLVLILALTGVALNHTDTLRLQERTVRSRWLLRWYGLRAPAAMTGWKCGQRWLLQSGDRLLLDGVEVMELAGEKLVGGVWFDEMVVAVTDRRLHLFSPDGRLVESLGGEAGVPVSVTAVAVDDGTLVLQTAEGAVTSRDLESWKSAPETRAIWATTVPLPLAQATSAEAAMQGEGLPLERVVLDLHSGRIFGRYGHLLMDAAALILLLLTATGLWLNFGARRRPRPKS